MRRYSVKFYGILFITVLAISLFSLFSDLGLLPHHINQTYQYFHDTFSNPQYPEVVDEMCQQFKICRIEDLSYFSVYADKLQHLFNGKIHFESSMIFGTQMFEIYLPFIASLLAYKSSKKYFAFGPALLVRFKKRFNVSLLKMYAIDSAKGALCVFMAYSAFLLCIQYWSRNSIPLFDHTSYEMARSLFSDLLGKTFYVNNMAAYYLIEGFFKYFFFTLMYSLLAGFLSLTLQKKKIALLFPPLYYFTLSLVFSILGESSPLFSYINPATIVSGSFPTPFSSPLFILGFFIPVYLSIILSIKLRKQSERT